MALRSYPRYRKHTDSAEFPNRRLCGEGEMSDLMQAADLIRAFKGASYRFGGGALAHVGELASQLGKTASIVRGSHAGSETVVHHVRRSLDDAGIHVLGEFSGAAPNAPRQDVERLAAQISDSKPGLLVAVGGGSNIDATKAADVLATLGGPVDRYFGMSLVSDALAARGVDIIPVLAVQTASSSAAHLTKYSNITDLETGQKKLIVDDAIVPSRAAFQYDVTTSMSPGFTADGALDGISHMIEVLYGAVGQSFYEKAEEVAGTGVNLIVTHLERAVDGPADLEARTALGLGTDLGGYAIMIGGTNGGHLTSFSLVDVLSHGRACAITNPYYTVFFAPAIQRPLRLLGRIYRNAGLTRADVDSLQGRALGVAVAEAMMALSRRIGFPVTLGEVEGFSSGHIDRALAAAKNPQLRMKLQNMPIPLTAEMVDDYMGPILEAATVGDLGRIRSVL
jgi:alcohol dehydrogenase